MTNDLFQMDLTDQELQQVTGGNGISNVYGSETSTYGYPSGNGNYSTASFSGNATNYNASAYGNLQTSAGYSGANNAYFAGGQGAFYGYN